MVRKFLTALAASLGQVEKSTLSAQVRDELDNQAPVTQRIGQGSVWDSLLRGEITEEVKQLRWKMYSVDQSASKFRVTKDGELRLADQTIIGLEDEFKLLFEVPSITRDLSISEAFSIADGMTELKSNIRQAGGVTPDGMSGNTNPVEVDPNDKLFIKEGESTTIGAFTNEQLESNLKSHKSIIVNYDHKPKFNLTDYLLKIHVKGVNGEADNYRLDCYVSKYPLTDFSKDKLFVNEMAKAVVDTKLINTLDISTIEFVTERGINVEDYMRFEYGVLETVEVVEHKQYYVIKLNVVAIVNGVSVIEKFRNEIIDELYKNKAPKGKL